MNNINNNFIILLTIINLYTSHHFFEGDIAVKGVARNVFAPVPANK